MSLFEKHIHLINLVNASVTKAEHDIRQRELSMWRIGVEDTGRKLDYCDCDLYFMAKGIDRPMVCGVWLDWQPKTTEEENFAPLDELA